MSENEPKAGAENAKSGKAVILPFVDLTLHVTRRTWQRCCAF